MMIVERPDMIVTTGAEIAIPAFVIGRLMRAKTLFLESAARVTSTSRTGRILYHVSDFFFVQWPSNRSLYGPKAVYKGGLL
jgi:UDP-N-acetylglucosamine:LPS N-acetylglucosamine transferase